MLTFFTIVAVVVLAIILFFLGVGLIILIGIVLVAVCIIALISSLFGGGFEWNKTSTTTTSSTQGTVSDDESLAIVDKFHGCLMESDPDPCRQKFTLWDEKDKEIIRQLSKQIKEELGKRENNHTVTQFERSETNGQVVVKFDQESDFAKKKSVKEHYVLESDPKDKGKLKIKDINWDY